MNPSDRLTAIYDILREYRKQNASVLTTTKVERTDNTGAVQVAGVPLKVLHLAEGKPVPVYTIILSNAYADTVRWDIIKPGYNVAEGLLLPGLSQTPPMLFFQMEITEAYIIINGIFGSGVHINQGVDINDAAIGPLIMWAFTTPEDGDDPKFGKPSRGLNAAQVGA